MTLFVNKVVPKAHHDFLCHQKVHLSLQLAEAAVKREANSPEPGHEQEDLRWGIQELQVPANGQPLWKAEKDSTSRHTLGHIQSSESAVVSCAENRGKPHGVHVWIPSDHV